MDEPKTQISTEPVPEGKIRLRDGSIADRTEVVFGLVTDKVNKKIEYAIDGTKYYRNDKGMLINLSKKKKKNKKWKRNHRNTIGKST